MKQVILLQNTFIGRERRLAGEVVEVSNEQAKHLASLNLAHIQEPVPEPEPVLDTTTDTTTDTATEVDAEPVPEQEPEKQKAGSKKASDGAKK